MCFFTGRFEHALDHGLVTQLVQAAPETDRQTGQECCTQCRGFTHLRTLDMSAEDVCLELHQEVVGHCTAVHAQRLEAFAGVLLHGVEHVAGLIGDGFQRCTNDVIDFTPRVRPNNAPRA